MKAAALLCLFLLAACATPQMQPPAGQEIVIKVKLMEW